MDLLDVLFILAGVMGFVVVLTVLSLRRIVKTDEVHIVQYASKTVNYGTQTVNGNSYYQWPAWIPVLGVTRKVLPLSIFALELENYEAYDLGRLPFMIDVKAFFQVDSALAEVAAKSIETPEILEEQLVSVLQGAARSILASSEIETIMQGRSEFGEKFTLEVASQLPAWGLKTIKNIELMDIRDSKESRVIRNIMDKKKSEIEKESRIAVAANNKMAEVAEIESRREVDLGKQEAAQTVGLRTAEAEKTVQLAQESRNQTVLEQQKVTKEKEMMVLQVQEVKTAEISQQVQVVKAEQEKKTTILAAEGQLEAKKREAEGTTAVGQAEAEVMKAKELAPISAQVELATKIGENKDYQKYLIDIKQVEANRDIGIEQAKALTKADIKIISNTENPTSGLDSVRDVFSSKGGMQMGAAIEGFANTEAGQAVLAKLGWTPKTKDITTSKSH